MTHASLFLHPFVAHPDGFARLAFAGPAGVGFFFVLSGFVLAWSHRDSDRGRAFWRRRAARVVPNHLLTWALTGALLVGIGIALHPSGTVLSALLLHAWVPRQSVIGAMDTPSWSLSVEVFFYALFPVLYARATSLRTQSRRPVMALACLVPLLAAVTQPAWSGAFPAGTKDYLLFTFPPVRLAEFVLGVLLALEVRDGRWPRLPVAGTAASALLALGLVDVVHDQRWYVVLPLLPFVLLVGAVAQSDVEGRPSFLRHPWLVRAGQWSFALYLLHWPVLIAYTQASSHSYDGVAASTALVLALLAVTTALSAAVFTCWERPLERRLRATHDAPAALRRLSRAGG